LNDSFNYWLPEPPDDDPPVLLLLCPAFLPPDLLPVMLFPFGEGDDPEFADTLADAEPVPLELAFCSASLLYGTPRPIVWLVLA
jgi:hypothetical protein